MTKYTSTFCGSYSLETGTRFIAWFYILSTKSILIRLIGSNKLSYELARLSTSAPILVDYFKLLSTNSPGVLEAIKRLPGFQKSDNNGSWKLSSGRYSKVANGLQRSDNNGARQVIYTINIFMNIFALDIVKSYKETVDENIEYDETSLLAFHYIFLSFGILTILLSVATLVKLSNQPKVFMEFIFQWGVFRYIMTLVGILYVCAKMNHIVTVVISCGVLVIDLCCTSYFIGIIASFVKTLEDADYFENQESNDAKLRDVYLVSHKKTSDVGQVSSVVVDVPYQVTCETHKGIQNAGLESETKQEATGNSTEPSDGGITEEPKKAVHVKTEGETSEPNLEKALDPKPESTTLAAVDAEREKENTDPTASENTDDGEGASISGNDSKITKEQKVEDRASDSDPAVVETRTCSDEVAIQESPADIGVQNPAFEVVELNQIRTEAIAVNEKGDGELDEGGLDTRNEKRNNPGIESCEVELPVVTVVSGP